MVVFKKKPAKVAPAGASSQTPQPTNKKLSTSKAKHEVNSGPQKDIDDEQQDLDDGDFELDSDDALIPDDAFEFSAEVARPASPAPLVRYSDIAAGRPHTYHGTPVEKVVGTFELFEQVLGYLPVKEVLRATQVCRAFKKTIENSSLLQAKLFLGPDLTARKLAVSDSGSLLSGARAERHIAAAEAQDNHRRTGEIALRVIHPALKRTYVSERYKHMGAVKFAEVCVESTQNGAHRFLHFRDFMRTVVLSSTSSLDKMFLCQPPVTQATVHLRKKHLSLDGVFHAVPICVHNPQGVTFGDVLLAAQRKMGLSREVFQKVCLSGMSVDLNEGIVVSSKARKMADKAPAGELRTEDDPTRWVLQQDGKYELKDGGFEFYEWRERYDDGSLKWDDE